jgi:hypothetical protein
MAVVVGGGMRDIGAQATSVSARSAAAAALVAPVKADSSFRKMQRW